MNDQIKTLAGIAVVHGDELKETAAQIIVLASAVCALVRTHPDPEAFAKAFRAEWMRRGQQHSNDELDPPTQRGMDEALSSIEEACPVPLKVRPPSS